MKSVSCFFIQMEWAYPDQGKPAYLTEGLRAGLNPPLMHDLNDLEKR